jgi:hypothetical protein
MTLRQACCVGALALMSCGGVDLFNDAGTDAGTDAGVTYTFVTGTYGVTNAAAAAGTTDQCGFLPSYQDAMKKIAVDVANGKATFNLSNTPASTTNPMVSWPVTTVAGNTIGPATEANYTIAFTNPTCTVRVKRTVVGNVVANNAAALTLSFTVATESGTCTPAPNGNTVFNAIPCASTYQFTATKQ